jgi:hypothetical protein
MLRDFLIRYIPLILSLLYMSARVLLLQSLSFDSDYQINTKINQAIAVIDFI